MAEMLAAAKLMEPLAARVGHLEHVTQVLQLQLARLTESVLVQLDSRLRLLEQQMQLEEDEPRENPLLSLVVSQQGRPNAMVTVDVRAKEKVQALKVKAHEQLVVWSRFCGEEELPPLKECQLWKLEEVLEDAKRLHQCGLSNGDELQLVSANALLEAEEEEVPSGPVMTVLVSHPLGEVNVEARSSDTVRALKRRALEQLAVWCRFTAACDDEAVPKLEHCELYASGSGDGTVLPAPLRETDRLSRCGLQTGAQLYLRPA